MVDTLGGRVREGAEHIVATDPPHVRNDSGSFGVVTFNLVKTAKTAHEQ